MSPPKTLEGRGKLTLGIFAIGANSRPDRRNPEIEKFSAMFLPEPVDASPTAKWTRGPKS
jgi:hypothetical protein